MLIQQKLKREREKVEKKEETRYYIFVDEKEKRPVREITGFQLIRCFLVVVGGWFTCGGVFRTNFVVNKSILLNIIAKYISMSKIIMKRIKERKRDREKK